MMSHRRNKNTQPIPKAQQIAELESQLAQAQVLIQKMEKQIERLQAEIEGLKRAGRRQATQAEGSAECLLRQMPVERPC